MNIEGGYISASKEDRAATLPLQLGSENQESGL
jgi:hypothetical protein